jgi:hypothetical protein
MSYWRDCEACDGSGETDQGPCEACWSPFGLIRLVGVWIPGSVEAAVERMWQAYTGSLDSALWPDPAVRGVLERYLQAAMSDRAVALDTEPPGCVSMRRA